MRLIARLCIVKAAPTTHISAIKAACYMVGTIYRLYTTEKLKASDIDVRHNSVHFFFILQIARCS